MATLNPIHLINEKDMQYVRHFIEMQESYCLLNIFSSKGFGKSTFLHVITDVYRNKLPTTYTHVLDYSPENPESSYRLDKLLAQIYSDLQGYASDKDKAALHGNEDLDTVSNLAAGVVELVSIFSREGKTTIFLIDDYDQLPYGARAIFEDIVLSRVIDKPLRTKVILTSGHELSFIDRFDLRVRLKTRALNALDENDIVRTISQNSGLAPVILKWSGGIPYLVDFLIDKAKERNADKDVNHIRERELIDQDYRSHISKVMFPDAKLLSEEVVDVLALLRRFDVAILSAILPKVDPNRFSSFKQKHYLDLIREFGDRVYWRDQGGYALNNILRVMLSSYIRVFEPALYEKVNTITATTYDEWLKEEFRIHYLTEMLYHQILLRKARETDENKITTFVSNTILNFIEGKEKTPPHELDGLDEIKHMLSDDPDLRPYIKQEVFDAIEKILHQ